MTPRAFAYASMGTIWTITIWDPIDEEHFSRLAREIPSRSRAFGKTYSRFDRSSLVWSLTERRGTVEVPADLVEMLRLYELLYRASGGKCTPLVGFALRDLGYDERYSLTPKETVSPVPPLPDALRIVDDTHIELRQSVLLDLGALGKGYFVDRIADLLAAEGVRRFLVDGSGDVYYRGDGQPLRAGLEHPGDPTKAIGVFTITEGALCGSAGNRRRWRQYHHTIDPHTLRSPEEVIATWAYAGTAALADGLATCLFFAEPEAIEGLPPFEYCVLNREYRVRRSRGFAAELFS